ncbi:Histone-lysine N-methyltransferase, H3 lysine-79 specific [Mycena venus]|uniref:Histone-lysine N-methyltransferase, H3 lysine-79 specific n=1 Tax=Mycena venus TaxID=2733690 RepID=A0A8H6XZJ9_9AGAR|nr:Histone-lysine N-methyltransferase, H3 lysine-79 specific [Mycena venus]
MDYYRSADSTKDSSQPYYRDRLTDARTPQEKRRDYMREKRKANSTGRQVGRPSKQTIPTQVWRAKSVNAQDPPDFTSTMSTNTAEFLNHNPANFFNLLDVLKKYRYNVNSLILPISSREVVEDNINAYKNYFSDTSSVVVSLIYPVSLLEERFLLLEPRDPRSLTYNPVADLVSIVKDLYYVSKSEENTGLLQSWIEAVDEKDLAKFNQTFTNINTFFRHAHYRQNHHEHLGNSLCQQAYYRVITPNLKQLAKYRMGTDAVYGEIVANIPDVMIREGRLTETSHFVDMGSGIGNIVCLMSIQARCSSFGVEMMAQPAALAEKFAQQSMLRAQGCGLRIGKMQLVEADMLESELVKENIAAADVVLVSNRLFSAATNLSIAHLLNNLKDGAKVFTLMPLTYRFPMDRPLTERTRDHPGNIFRVAERIYPRGSVSWSDAEGPYYIHVVDKAWHDIRIAELHAKTRRVNTRTCRDSRALP